MSVPEDRFPWETQVQYEYRMGISRLASQIHDVLHDIETTVTPGSDCLGIAAAMRRCHQRAHQIISPAMYEEAHVFLLQSVDAYFKAAQLLTTAVPAKDGPGIAMASRWIIEGNSFLTIAKSRLWAAVEKRTSEARASATIG